jgi:hypothetical protein
MRKEQGAGAGQGAMPKDKSIAEAMYPHLRKDDPPKPAGVESATAAEGVYPSVLAAFGLIAKE